MAVNFARKEKEDSAECNWKKKKKDLTIIRIKNVFIIHI